MGRKGGKGGDAAAAREAKRLARTKSAAADQAPAEFVSAVAFRKWLSRHHATATELTVRCFKVAHAKRGLTYTDAVDEALCFGWIDGVRRGYDKDSFLQRFTPRKTKSNWSLINIRKVEALVAAGRMSKAGLAAFEARDTTKTGVYSFEQSSIDLEPALTARFRRHREAWQDFQTRPAWYRRTSTHWVMSAKRPETRERRLDILIDCSARHTTIPLLTRA